jgi:hypothetical protein
VYHGMGVIAKRHEYIEHRLQIRLRRKPSGIYKDCTEGGGTAGSRVGFAIVDNFFDEIVYLCTQECGTTQASKSTESLTASLTDLFIGIEDAFLGAR